MFEKGGFQSLAFGLQYVKGERCFLFPMKITCILLSFCNSHVKHKRSSITEFLFSSVAICGSFFLCSFFFSFSQPMESVISGSFVQEVLFITSSQLQFAWDLNIRSDCNEMWTFVCLNHQTRRFSPDLVSLGCTRSHVTKHIYLKSAG